MTYFVNRNGRITFRFPETLSICKHELTSDFSFYRSFDDSKKVPHIFCHDCGTHWMDGKTYTADEWEKYINED